jgi:hypothetical protein
MVGGLVLPLKIFALRKGGEGPLYTRGGEDDLINKILTRVGASLLLLLLGADKRRE